MAVLFQKTWRNWKTSYRYQSKPITVVIAGCFSHLHYGHIILLTRARQLGDELIVLINSDEYIYKTKGYLPDSAEVRKTKLLVTNLVDHVLFFGDDPTDLICQLKPDIICAGSDHTYQEIYEKGGWIAQCIVILPRTLGIASRDLAKKSSSL
jgi:cytidyltransferase-like protein